jgi:hypothetical protein
MPQPQPPAPAPDRAWLATTAADWTALWASPLAARVLLPENVRPLRRLFGLYDQRDRYAAAARRKTLVSGSTGQPMLNPLLRHLPALDAAILALEAKFGLTPHDRLRLGEAFGDAHRSLAELAEVNARLAAADATSTADVDDPRLLVVPAAALGQSAAPDRRPAAAELRPTPGRLDRGAAGPRRG